MATEDRFAHTDIATQFPGWGWKHIAGLEYQSVVTIKEVTEFVHYTHNGRMYLHPGTYRVTHFAGSNKLKRPASCAITTEDGWIGQYPVYQVTDQGIWEGESWYGEFRGKWVRYSFEAIHKRWMDKQNSPTYFAEPWTTGIPYTKGMQLSWSGKPL